MSRIPTDSAGMIGLPQFTRFIHALRQRAQSSAALNDESTKKRGLSQTLSSSVSSVLKQARKSVDGDLSGKQVSLSVDTCVAAAKRKSLIALTPLHGMTSLNISGKLKLDKLGGVYVYIY